MSRSEDLPKPHIRRGLKSCKHGWQYEGPIEGHEGVGDLVIVRCCWNCGRREMAYTGKFGLAKGDYALDEHYAELIGGNYAQTY